LALALAIGCKAAVPDDTPQAAWARWADATARRDLSAYFDAIVPPNQQSFLMNLIALWQSGELATTDPAKHAALGELLQRHHLDSIQYPLGLEDRARMDSIPSLPAYLAELSDAIGGVGPRGVALWDLLPQPVSLGEVGPVDTYESAAATATLRVFVVEAMAPVERTEGVRFFRDQAARWRVSSPGF
jgi:hypothetical protein